MGLHLNYELRLTGDVPRSRVASLLGALRKRALSTQVASVSPLADLSADGEADSDDGPDATRAAIRLFAKLLGDPVRDEEIQHYTGDPCSAIGFTVDPGRGSETATFGLMNRRAEIGGDEEWFWWCACKTQYVSVVSDAHLVTVHTSLVAILDAALELGFDVVVRDETGYWESRSASVLLESVAKMNRLIAKFAGALSDAIGNEHSVAAPIFEHRAFERLEMGE
jgi:hypothetical protein